MFIFERFSEFVLVKYNVHKNVCNCNKSPKGSTYGTGDLKLFKRWIAIF